MNLQQMKDVLDTLTPEQLTQPFVVFLNYDSEGNEVTEINISDEDIYWEHHGDCLGNLQEAKKYFGDEWESEKDDLIIVSKGTVSIWIENESLK